MSVQLPMKPSAQRITVTCTCDSKRSYVRAYVHRPFLTSPNIHASEMAKKHLNLKNIRKLVVEIWGMMVPEKQYSSARNRNINSKSENIVTLSDKFTQKQDETMLWKAKNDELKDEFRNKALKNELASESIKIFGDNVAILHKEVELNGTVLQRDDTLDNAGNI